MEFDAAKLGKTHLYCFTRLLQKFSRVYLRVATSFDGCIHCLLSHRQKALNIASCWRVRTAENFYACAMFFNSQNPLEDY